MASSRPVRRLLALIVCLVASCTLVAGSGTAAPRVSPSKPCGRNQPSLAVYFAGRQVAAFSLSQAHTECSLRNDPIVSYNYGQCQGPVTPRGCNGIFPVSITDEPLQECHLRPNVVVRGVPGHRYYGGIDVYTGSTVIEIQAPPEALASRAVAGLHRPPAAAVPPPGKTMTSLSVRIPQTPRGPRQLPKPDPRILAKPPHCPEGTAAARDPSR